jgi:hypothetical protein
VAVNGSGMPRDGRGPRVARPPPPLGQGGGEEVERESHEEASSDLCMCRINFYSGYFLLAFNGFVVSSVLIPLDYSCLFS